MTHNFAARLAQAQLATKDEITDFVKETDFDNKLKKLNKKVTSNNAKHVLVESELNEKSEKVELILIKELRKYLVKRYGILIGAKHFSSFVLENYLVFISANNYIVFFSGIPEIYSWKSKRMSEESIKTPPRPDNNFALIFISSYSLPDVEFGHCLINSNISDFKKVIHLHISC